MRTVLYRSMLVFALLMSCGAFGEDQQPDCRSWWSGPDSVCHCLLSGNGDDDAITPTQKGASDAEILPAEPPLDDISTPDNTPQLPPDFQITDVSEK